MAIILARHGQPAVRLERTTIDRESYLQQYIFAHPEALPLDEVDEDVRLLVLLREFPTASGPIDALATDGDGVMVPGTEPNWLTVRRSHTARLSLILAKAK